MEPAADSSRNFVLRLVDSSTGRHAFVGLSFADRSEAFDFNVALVRYQGPPYCTAQPQYIHSHLAHVLAVHEKISPEIFLVQSDHEKQLRRAADIQSRADDPATASSTSTSSAQPAQDLRLKQGETIR